MSKTLKEVQAFNREAIIMAVHPECKTLEEALQRELKCGCIINYWVLNYEYDEDRWENLLKQGIISILHKNFPINDSQVYFLEENKQYPKLKNESLGKLDIIGLPNTLARVLKAIETNRLIIRNYANGLTFFSDSKLKKDRVYLFSWKLLNDDGTDCALEQQEKATQRAIAKLLRIEWVYNGS